MISDFLDFISTTALFVFADFFFFDQIFQLRQGITANITTTTEVTGNQQDVTVPYQTITPEQAKQIIDAGGAVILDVRQPDEYATGHIRGAILLPVGEIEAQSATVLPDKNTKILVYCRSGNRSAVAAAALQTLGYTDVSDFGGIIDWPYDDYVVK